MKKISNQFQKDSPDAGLSRENVTRSFREKFRRWSENRSTVWVFGIKFCGLMALFYVLALTPVCDRWFYSYLELNARLAGGMLNWLGQESHVSEITIRSTQFAITVRRGCDAIEPSWFFCAALIAFPASISRKLLGMLVGVLLLQVLNLVRIVSLYFIGLRYPGFFGTAHVEIWPAAFIIVAILLWIGWIDWAKNSRGMTWHVPA